MWIRVGGETWRWSKFIDVTEITQPASTIEQSNSDPITVTCQKECFDSSIHEGI